MVLSFLRGSVEPLQKGGVLLAVERFGHLISQPDEVLLEIAKEGGDLVDVAAGGVVGAAAGVEAAVAPRAELAFGRGVAARGDDIVLPGSKTLLIQ